MARPNHATRSSLLRGIFLGVVVIGVAARGDVRAADSTPAPAGEATPIVASGALSAHLIAPGQGVRAWLTLRNSSPQSIHEVWLLLPLEAPDYQIKKIYRWNVSSGPAAKPATQPLGSESAQVVASELSSGESITVWADFLPLQPHAARTLTAAVSWKTQDGRASQISVTLGDLQVQGRWDRWRESFIYQVVKDFALPLVVLLLPFLIQWMAQKRARLAETWNLMLPDSHHTTMTYYMPLQASLRHALGELEAYRTATDLAKKKTYARELFYYFLMFQRRLRHSLSQLGGFYFKDRIGERMAVCCLIEVDKLYPGMAESDRVETAQVLKRLGINEALDSFLAKLDGRSTTPKTTAISAIFQKRWNHFYGAPTSAATLPAGAGAGPTTQLAAIRPWLGSRDFDNAILCLRAFGSIIEYEMNRPYEHWYGEKETLHLAPECEQKLKELAQEAARRENIADFPQQVEKYIRKGKRGSRWYRVWIR